MTNGNYTAIDTETTGLNPANSEIIEIGAVRFRNHKPVGEYKTFVRPKGTIPEYITSLTGISEEMTAGSPHIEEILPDLLKFIGNDPIVGHNLPFDLSFFSYAGLNFRAYGNELIDTLVLSRAKVKGPDRIWSQEKRRYVSDMNSTYLVRNHRLSTMCSYFGISTETSHRAVSDARATGELYRKLLEYK